MNFVNENDEKSTMVLSEQCKFCKGTGSGMK